MFVLQLKSRRIPDSTRSISTTHTLSFEMGRVSSFIPTETLLLLEIEDPRWSLCECRLDRYVPVETGLESVKSVSAPQGDAVVDALSLAGPRLSVLVVPVNNACS